MGKMELEVKILDINEQEFIEKIKGLGAVFVEESIQQLYTYDLPTIYGRYIDILTQLNNPENSVKYESSIEKLKLLFFEIDHFLTVNDKKMLTVILGKDNFSSLINNSDLKAILNRNDVKDFVSKFHNNPHKWIRVRQTNDRTTLAIKHVLTNDNSGIQQMLETEMIIPSLKEGRDFLEALGLAHKSYQEKKRTTYLFDDHEIDIDTWPGIPTFFEVEGKNINDIEETLEKLGYHFKDTVSCTADDIYIRYGKIPPNNMREVKFEN